MREVLWIAWLQIKRVIKNRALLGMGIILPLVMTALFTAGGRQNQAVQFPVALIDQDESILSGRLTEALEADPSLKIRKVEAAELPRLLADRQIASGITIPAGFEAALREGRPIDLELVQPPNGNADWSVQVSVQRSLRRVSSQYKLALQLATPPASAGSPANAGAPAGTGSPVASAGAPVSPEAVQAAWATLESTRQAAAVTVDAQSAAGGAKMQNDQNVQTAAGLATTFVMMLVFMMSSTLLLDQQNGTWNRLYSAPVHPTLILIGYLLSFFVTGIVQFGILILGSSLLFGQNWGPLGPLFLIASFVVLCAAGLGLLVATLTKTPEQQRAIGILAVSASSMLGGAYWPLDIVGPVMRQIGYLMPQAWAMEGFRGVLLQGDALSAILLPCAVLFGFTLCFLAAGTIRLRHRTA
jgi:ABC-2 type transport system permease protein